MPDHNIVSAEQQIVSRSGGDILRLDVRPTPDDGDVPGEFQVQISINGVEITSAGAGLGMDPYDLLVPTNRLLAADLPNTVIIARCSCGELGCGYNDVTITHHGDAVRWEWLLSSAVSFTAGHYDAEIQRAAADYSWETPERTAGRLVLTYADRERLLHHGLTLTRVTRRRDQEMFEVELDLQEDYRISLDVLWHDRSPEEMADEICAMLARPPHKWRARWRPLKPTLAGPPSIARRSWRRG